MLRTAFLVVLGAISCYAVSDFIAMGRLYHSVTVGDYNSAVALSKCFDYREKVISVVVDKLINETQSNLVEFAAHLWKNDGQEIIKNHFPLEIRSIVGQHLVKLVSKRDNMVLKLNAKVDSEGDRTAYGDSNHMIGERMAWKFIPVFSTKVYFKIYNPHTNQYLKLGGKKDSDGDYQAFGDTKSASFKHQFYLQPAKYEGEILFYIFNREYQQALKLSRAVDTDGDRWVYGENGTVTAQPHTFGWVIQPY